MRVLCVQHQDDCPPGLVGERLVELGARLDVVDPRGPLPDPRAYDLVVPLGSEDCAADDSLPHLRAEWDLLAAAVRADVAVFGICFGAQLLCRVLGGTVAPLPGGPEIDWMLIEADGPRPVPAGPWLNWHHDTMTPPPDTEIARSASGTQAWASGRHMGVQFHPEADVDITVSWVQDDIATLDRLGRNADELVARMRAESDLARARVAQLIDRVLRRAELV